MKIIPRLILILTLAQAACNLPQAILSTQATPSLPTAIVAVTTPTLASATAPVSSDTPPADTSTPEATPTQEVRATETTAPSPTQTETSTPEKLFSEVNLSAQVISPNCEPKAVHFEVTPANPNIYRVVLFIRLNYKTTGDKTNWNEGFAMKPSGGKFIYDLQASKITDFNKFKDPVAWVQFQFVVTDISGAVIGRSEVFTDKLTISAICL